MKKVNTNRILSFILDLLLFSIFASILSSLLFKKNDSLNILNANLNFRVFTYYSFILMYFLLFDIVNSGVTPGKSIMNMKNRNLNDTQLSTKQRIIRSFAKFLSILLLPISTVIYLTNGYSIHDSICKTKTLS